MHTWLCGVNDVDVSEEARVAYVEETLLCDPVDIELNNPLLDELVEHFKSVLLKILSSFF